MAKNLRLCFWICALIVQVCVAQGSVSFGKSDVHKSNGFAVGSYSDVIYSDVMPMPVYADYLAGQAASKRYDLETGALFFKRVLDSISTKDLIAEEAFLLFLKAGFIPEALNLTDHSSHFGEETKKIVRLLQLLDAVKKGNYNKARSKLYEGDQDLLGKQATLLLSAWIMQGQGETSKALSLIEDESYKNNWRKLLKLTHAGMIASVAGRKHEALKQFRTAYRLGVNDMRVADNYGLALALVGKNEAAIDIYEAYDKIVPQSRLMMKHLADIKAGNPPEPSVTSVVEGVAELMCDIGTATESINFSTAESRMIYLQLALYLRPDFDLALFPLAAGLAGHSALPQAISVLERVRETSHFLELARIQIGYYYQIMEDYEKAQEYIGGVFRRNSTRPDIALILADLLRNRKYYSRAAEMYSLAIGLSIKQKIKTEWRVFYFRGISYERSGNWYRAEKDFRKALELNPNEPAILNYLGYSLVERGYRVKSALQMIEKASELNPDSGQIMDSLGWAYHRVGRNEDAVEALERAVLLEPGNYTINDHLGDVYWVVGRKREAFFQWSHARDLNPSDKVLEQILIKLKKGLEAINGQK